MPVWHKTLKRAREEGKVVLLGVIQEQHPDRCRLFAQWQQWDWPILHDPINHLELNAVPVIVAIDEHGVVRDTRPRPETIGKFLDTDYPAPVDAAPAPTTAPNLSRLKSEALAEAATREAKLRYANSLLLWQGQGGDSEKVASAIRTYLAVKPKAAADWFRLGVAYRMRFESNKSLDGDFQSAVDAWSRALALNPNQYIYRRRIEQYGPRLAKPYPFYDWVPAAREAIKARGETPIQLRVEPSGAEFASPLRRLQSHDDAPTSPDPQNRITRDARLVKVATAAVPALIQRSAAARLHVEFQVNGRAHWNNEAGRMKLWIDAPEGWTIATPLLEGPEVQELESQEPRRFDFEIKAPADAQDVTVNAFALFHICEEASGVCRYVRKDVKFHIRVDR